MMIREIIGENVFILLEIIIWRMEIEVVAKHLQKDR